MSKSNSRNMGNEISHLFIWFNVWVINLLTFFIDQRSSSKTLSLITFDKLTIYTYKTIVCWLLFLYLFSLWCQKLFPIWRDSRFWFFFILCIFICFIFFLFILRILNFNFAFNLNFSFNFIFCLNFNLCFICIVLLFFFSFLLFQGLVFLLNFTISSWIFLKLTKNLTIHFDLFLNIDTIMFMIFLRLLKGL